MSSGTDATNALKTKIHGILAEEPEAEKRARVVIGYCINENIPVKEVNAIPGGARFSFAVSGRGISLDILKGEGPGLGVTELRCPDAGWFSEPGTEEAAIRFIHSLFRCCPDSGAGRCGDAFEISSGGLTKGKRISDGKWIFGYPAYAGHRVFLSSRCDSLSVSECDAGNAPGKSYSAAGYVEIIPNTLCETAGMLKGMSVPVAAGDIVEAEGVPNVRGVVRYMCLGGDVGYFVEFSKPCPGLSCPLFEFHRLNGTLVVGNENDIRAEFGWYSKGAWKRSTGSWRKDGRAALEAPGEIRE